VGKVKKDILNVICCPACKGDLSYDANENHLACQECLTNFPIEDGIPMLLRRMSPENLYCHKCQKEVEALKKPWFSLSGPKGNILRCPECKVVLLKRNYNELSPVEKSIVLKQFIAKGFDISAPIYESFRFPLVSMMIGINPFTAVHKLIKIPAKKLSANAGQKVMDLASGTGFAARELSIKVGQQGFVFAVDLSIGMLKMGKKKAMRMGLNNIAFIQGDMEAIPLKDEEIGGITCLNISVTNDAVAEISRVLQPGASVVMSVGRISDNPSFIGRLLARVGKNYGFPLYRIEEIIEILRHHGFDEIDAHVHIINMMMLVVAKKTG
jgi:uncharacterized protein YbaR (Trm112 family)/SAM-dependent methyltransferase